MDCVSASAFSVMRGHINDGQRVRLRNGRMLYVMATARGWTLVDVQTGRRAIDQDTPAGSVIESEVVRLDTEAA